MNLLEYLISILLYLPILIIPIGILFWYAFVSRKQADELRPEKSNEKTEQTK